MSDDELYRFYRWLVDTQGVNPESKEMRYFRHKVDHSSSEILERVKRIKSVKALNGIYG
jgi:hypothetical protein